jgi:hypothetical protein
MPGEVIAVTEKRKRIKREFLALLFVLLLFGCTAVSHAAAVGEWFLMSRPGECVNINSLKSMIPDLGESTGPQSFIEMMKKRGHKVSAEEVTGFHGEEITVRVPEKGLALTFATGKVCSNIR